MTIEEAEKMILQVLKNVMEDSISQDNVEMSIIRSDTKKLETRSPEQLKAVIDTLAWIRCPCKLNWTQFS